MKRNKKNKVWVVEAMVGNILVKVTSDGTPENTVIESDDEKMYNRITNTIKLGIRAPYIYDSPSISADYTPLGMMSALESLARGRVAFTILPTETRAFLKKNYGGYAELGWTG